MDFDLNEHFDEKSFKPGLLVILAGPGSIGKDTVASKVIEHYPNFSKVVTTTAREMRPGETQGYSYHFVSEEEFNQMLYNNKFLETNVMTFKKYGTTFEALKPFLEGENMTWCIDPRAAVNVRDIFIRAFSQKKGEIMADHTIAIYLAPTQFKILSTRMLKRGFTQEQIAERLNQDQRDYQATRDRFKHIIVNVHGHLPQTLEQVYKVIDQKLEELNQ